MKGFRRWVLLAMSLTLCVVLAAGCGKKPQVVTETPPPQTEVQPEPSAPVEPPPAPAPTIDYADLAPGEYGIEDVFFAYDVSALTEAAMAVLDKNARIMNEHPQVNYLVEGHCDERGTIEYNLALGEKRAKSVVNYLVSLGVAPARLRVVSYGEEHPFAQGHDESAWAANRRAHFAKP
mgnify:FL=1